MNLLFDIGCNRGKYTQDILRAFPECSVVCVEPQAGLASHLNVIFKNQINTGQIFVYEKAASNTEGSINLYPASDDTIATTSEEFRENSCFAVSEKIMSNGKMFKDHYSFYDPVPVDTITIDSLISTHGVPDRIKLDVEGHEHEALLGLSEKVPSVTFEWHETLKHKVLDAVGHLHSIGFTEFSTEIWYFSREYHDNEITDYKTKEDFATWFVASLNDAPPINQREWVNRGGMVWAR
tara:strand:- start:6069 stop:6779 length:711 start_codon:yes stop_codon:yes gene_type:complete